MTAFHKSLRCDLSCLLDEAPRGLRAVPAAWLTALVAAEMLVGAASIASAGGAVAQAPPAVRSTDPGAAPDTADRQASDVVFQTVHVIGICGAAGLTAALATAVILRVSNLALPARRRLVALHAALGLFFGVVAMTHGTVFFLRDILGHNYLALVEPGSWTCTLTLLLVLSGVGRRYDPHRSGSWAFLHRAAAAMWVAAVVWHVLAHVTK